MNRSLRRDYVWNTIGTSLNSFVSLILMVIVTRVNGIYDSGIFTFAFSLSMVFFMIALFGGRTYQVSDMKREFSSREYIFLKFITSVIALVAAIIMIVANDYDFFKAGLILSLVVFKIIEAIADPLYGIMQSHKELYKVGISMTLKMITGTVLFTIINLATKNILLASLSFLLVNILFVLVFDIPIVRKLEKIKMRFESLKEYLRGNKKIFKRSLYVFLFTFSGTLIVNIPRYFMDLYHESLQGYYGIIVMPATLIAIFVTFVMQPKIVDLAKKHNDRLYKEFNKIAVILILFSLAFGTIATIATYWIGADILSVVYGVDLKEYRMALTLIVLSGTITAIPTILANILTVMRKLKIQLILYLVSVALSVVLAMVLIGRYDINGGVWFFVAMAAFQTIAFAIVYAVILKRSMYEKTEV